MDERQFFTEKTESQPQSLNCPTCKQVGEYHMSERRCLLHEQRFEHIRDIRRRRIQEDNFAHFRELPAFGAVAPARRQ